VPEIYGDGESEDSLEIRGITVSTYYFICGSQILRVSECIYIYVYIYMYMHVCMLNSGDN